MHSSAWMNGQNHFQVGQPSQTSQVANQQIRTAKRPNNSPLYPPARAGVPKPQNVNFTPCNGTYSSGQTSYQQHQTAPQHAVSSQLASTGGTYNNSPLTNLIFKNATMQSLHTSTQTYTQQVLYQSPPPYPSNRSPPITNMMQKHAAHQRITSNWNHQVPPVQPLRSYAVKTTSPQHGQTSYTGTQVSTTIHNKHTAHNQNHIAGYRLNSTQHGFSTHAALPSQMSQPFGNNSHGIQANVPSGHFMHKSDMGQKIENRSSINSAAGTGQHMLNCQMTPGNTAKVSRTYSAGADYGHLANNNTVHPGKNLQLNHRDRMTETFQTKAPVALSVREAHNSRTSRSITDHSGPALPEPTRGVVPSTQHNLGASKGFYVTVTEDGCGNGFKADHVVFLGDKLDNTDLKRALNGSLPILQQFSERISPQRKETQSSVPNNDELHELPESAVKPNNNLNNTLPGQASQKAVAIVQPLSQKHNQAAQKQAFCETMTDHCKDNPTNEFVSISEKSFVSTAFAKNNMFIHSTDGSNSSKDDHSEVSEVSNETRDRSSLNMDSAEPEDPSQNHLKADEAESELLNKMQSKQPATLTAQHSQTPDVPVSQNSEVNKCESPEDPTAKLLDFFPIPTVSWTIEDLTKLVESTNVLMPTDFDIKKKLRLVLKESHSDNSLLSLDKYKKLIAEVREFRKEHVTLKSVILSQINWRSLHLSQLKCFHVLKHDDIHREVPYTSSWLNISDQLDDIDKEFGFPWSLKCHRHQLESDSQEKPVGTVNYIPAQIVSEKENESMLQTELEKVKLDIEKQASVVIDTSMSAQTVSESQNEAMLQTELDNETQASGVVDNSTQILFTDNTEKAASSDPHYSFHIQVLPAEEAKIIFEQGLSNSLESEKNDSQQEKFTNGSAQHELPQVKDVKSSEVIRENRADSPIEQFCCITKWMEAILGSNKLSLSKCQCKQESSPKDVTKMSQEEAIQEEDLCMVTSESKSDLNKEGKENADKTGGNQTSIFRLPEECAGIIDLIEDNIPCSYSSIEPKDISLISVGSSLSSTSVISEAQIENLSSSESEIMLQLSEAEENCRRAQLNPAESCRSNTSAINETLIESLSSSEIETVIQMSDLKGDCGGRAQLKPVDSSESSGSVITEKEIRNLNRSESGSIQTSPLDDDFEQSQRKPKDRAATPRNIEHGQKHFDFRDESFESQQPSPDKTQKVPSLKQRSLHIPTFETPFSLSDKHKRHRKKRKRPDPDRFFPVLKKSRKHEDHVAPDKQRSLEGVSKHKVFADHSNFEPVAKNARVAKLFLFGSSLRKKRGFVDIERCLASHAAKAPETLTVNVTSSHRRPEPVPEQKYSVKQKIHREWSKSFLPTKIKHRRKISAQDRDFACLSDVGPKKPETGGPTNREGLSVSSERSSLTGTWTIKRSLSLSKRRSILNGLRLKMEKSKDVVTAKRPADRKRSASEAGNRTVKLPQENSVLRFNVLPNTFNLQDGPAGRKETTDSTSFTPDLVESKDKSLKITLKKTKVAGAWAPHPEKKYVPLSQSKVAVPKTSSLFHRFQKKYMEKTAIHG